MTLVEPYIGYLLSKYKETAQEGLFKIQAEAAKDESFASSFLISQQAIGALQQALQQRELETVTMETLCVLIEKCSGATDRSSAARSAVLREFIQDEPLIVFKRALSSTADASLGMNCAVLRFLSLAAKFVPKVLLARFNNQIPLHLPCFRQQLSYTQRRLRLYRAQFLLDLATSRFMDPSEVILSHGFLTSLMEDGAELLLEGSENGQRIGKEALRMLDESFIRNRALTAEQKRSRLLAQRNVIRILVKALDYPPVSDEVAQLLMSLVTVLLESPADYTRSRVDSGEDRGMPNYILFLLLRQLRPKKSPRIGEIVTRILTLAPDLIRPYFARFSSHLIEDNNSSSSGNAGGNRIAPSTGRIAIMNLMTRIFMAPLPYHLTHHLATLNFATASADVDGMSRSGSTAGDTFYNMSPRDVADEICPRWVAEFTHKIINGSTDLLFLTLAMQMTQAALYRAGAVLATVRRIRQKMLGNAAHVPSLDAVFEDVGAEGGWESFEAEVDAALLAALPKREEFWHRLTQQLHPQLLEINTSMSVNASIAAKNASKGEFVLQRLLMLMCTYSSVFRLRVSFISVLPHQLPVMNGAQQQQVQQQLGKGKGSISYVGALLHSDVDFITRWSPETISLLCSLLCCSLVNGVPMNKMHHITMVNPKGGISEWPLLLRLLVWASRKKQDHLSQDPATAKAIAWVAHVVQWAVHGVTLSLSCERDEIFLWMEVMPLEAIPCFLHTLNHLLQRNLSKAADRVAEEFLHAENGVLVMAAQNFIAKTKEKQEEGISASKKGPSGKKDGATHPSASDVWVDDLKLSLPFFEKTVEQVCRRWNERAAIHKSCAKCYASTEDEPQPAEQAFENISPVESIGAALSGSVLLPALTQFMAFRQSLHSPTPPNAAESSFMASLLASSNPVQSNQVDFSSIIKALKGEETATPSWYTMNALCWELAGALLRGFACASLKDLTANEGFFVFADELLQLIARQAKNIRAALADTREDGVVSLYFLVLCGAHVWMYRKAEGIPASLSAEEQESVLHSVGKLLRQTYRGTVGVVDRIRYASLLTIHYIEKASSEPRTKLFCNTDEKEEGREEHLNEDPQGKRRSRHCLKNARVPRHLSDNRFMIWGHKPVVYLTAEVDMLTFITDLWTDQELYQMSLEMPSRLHNTLMCGTAVFSPVVQELQRAPLHDITRAVFPEVTVEEDLTECLSSSAASHTIMDPRYLLPLLQTVFSLPREYIMRRFMGVRCFPYLLRSLSFTDPSLRCSAIAALSSVYIPPGPAKVVHSFARLKMIQLAQKKTSGNKSSDDTRTVVPRLPAPVSAMLVLSIKSLGRYDDPLHHHLVRFLVDTSEAFAVAVPFHHWLVSFPLDSVSLPLMIQQHEKTLKHGADGVATAADASAASAIEHLKKTAPPHLPFIIRILSHGCQTKGDAVAFVESQCLQSLMLLCGLLTASSAMRLEWIQCLTGVCFAQSSSAVAIYVAQEGKVFVWLLQFLLQLCRECGTRASLYAEPLFRDTMSLATRLGLLLQRHGEPGILDLLRHQIADHVVLLRQKLTEANITAKETLDCMEQMEQVWHHTHQWRSSARKHFRGTPQSETKSGNDGSSMHKKRKV